ncbi:restriction endonuclease subunit S [Geothermobacter hydrogeniphilus]|uniref:Restriction endonuclease subunit S n=1 Tax=Geothermobacter hydrogeniphilus TaxID=1969733 RepID=A0A2K2H974_9BACT|nr:restriction endonuclease subunit S [Geothermobacter hydrogeniphilus]
MGRYQTYVEYKDTHAQWLGKVPKHWDVLPNKFLSEMCKGRNPSTLESEYSKDAIPYLSMGYLRGQESPKYGKAESSAIKAKEGDILLLWDGSNAGEYIHAKKGLVSSTMARVLAIRDCDHKYYFYCCKAFEPELKLHTVGMGIPHVNGEQVRTQCFPQPPQEEQQTIANFLDHETAKIDTLIAKQQQLIKLLKEKRQAVISHAVTKGLNPDAPMKDSGVEWLGEVPEHWKVTRAKYLFDFVTSGSRGWAEYYSDSGSLFFRIANLTRETIEPKMDSVQFVVPPEGSEGERSKIKVEDLLISITADLGSVCVADKHVADGYVSQHVSLCRPNGKVANSRWLGYVVLSDGTKEQFVGAGYGGTKIQLSLEDIREFWVARPPAEEQIRLTEYIDEKLEQYVTLIGKAELQINLLQVRRTALISAAVTGKIDVRNWKPEQSESRMEKTYG